MEDLNQLKLVLVKNKRTRLSDSEKDFRITKRECQ